ncbi:MAG: hypothetical protein JWM68_167 [Verrucomicrobiales bacterium]|nr:hypothetical protein [Verrucomicrobiales bacterium]
MGMFDVCADFYSLCITRKVVRSRCLCPGAIPNRKNRMQTLVKTFRAHAGRGVKSTDGFTDAGSIVVSDAVKFVYVP